MALSVQKSGGGPVWPLGCIIVATPGTPICVMSLIDPNNLNAPGAQVSGPFPASAKEWTYNFRGIGIQGYHAAANNNGMVANNGQVYLLSPPSNNGGPGNRSDSGSMIKIIGPGVDFFYPSPSPGVDFISPYNLFIDADTAGDGALIVAYGGGCP